MNVSPDFCTINSINFLFVKNGKISLTSDRAIPVTMLIPGPAGLSSIRCAAQSEERGMMKMLNAGNGQNLFKQDCFWRPMVKMLPFFNIYFLVSRAWKFNQATLKPPPFWLVDVRCCETGFAALSCVTHISLQRVVMMRNAPVWIYDSQISTKSWIIQFMNKSACHWLLIFGQIGWKSLDLPHFQGVSLTWKVCWTDLGMEKKTHPSRNTMSPVRSLKSIPIVKVEKKNMRFHPSNALDEGPKKKLTLSGWKKNDDSFTNQKKTIRLVVRPFVRSLPGFQTRRAGYLHLGPTRLGGEVHKRSCVECPWPRWRWLKKSICDRDDNSGDLWGSNDVSL